MLLGRTPSGTCNTRSSSAQCSTCGKHTSNWREEIGWIRMRGKITRVKYGGAQIIQRLKESPLNFCSHKCAHKWFIRYSQLDFNSYVFRVLTDKFEYNTVMLDTDPNWQYYTLPQMYGILDITDQQPFGLTEPQLSEYVTQTIAEWQRAKCFSACRLTTRAPWPWRCWLPPLKTKPNTK